MNTKLFVLGSVNIDLSISADYFPQKGETINGSNFIQSLGGKGLNQAYYSAELGLPTILMSSIGNDPFENYVNDALKITNITPQIQVKNNETTGKAMIIKSERDNMIVLEHGANWNHNLDDIKKMIASNQPTYFLTQLEIPFNIAFEAIKFAKEQGITTFLNATPAEIDNEAIYQFLDYLIVNETECYKLSKINPSSDSTLNQAANCFLHQGVQNVIITLGAKGSYYKSLNFEWYQKPVKTTVINTVGAGDSYIGAFIYGLSQKKSVQQSMLLATKIASQVCESDSLHLKNLEI